MSSEPAPPASPAPPPDPFANVAERNPVDVILRTAQQHHVQLSMMADIKANILITVSSIVLTMSVSRLADPELRVAMAVLSGFTLFALFLAVLAVLPKYRPIRLRDREGPLPPGFNLLFFGHFAELERARFEREIAAVLATRGEVYRTMVRDLYGLGVYLARFKYRYLRLSYLFFLAGFVASSLIQGLQLLK
jgi:hypothetical protein